MAVVSDRLARSAGSTLVGAAAAVVVLAVAGVAAAALAVAIIVAGTRRLRRPRPAAPDALPDPAR